MAWLSDWSKRVKLTVDSSKIDENLVDFPVSINLDNTTASGVFDELHISIGKSWTDFELEINTGAEGTYDTVHAYTPYVIKDDVGYKMWYTGYDGSNYRIIYCDSNDGDNWFNHQMIIEKNAEGTYDTNFVAGPSVIKDGSIYKMWYGGNNGSNSRTIYCESLDGKNWSNFQLAIDIGSEGTYDTSGAFSSVVIRKSDILYEMWYTGYDGTNQRIIYATSVSGTATWSNFQMVIDKGSEGTYDTNCAGIPSVIKEGSIYKMWYSGYNNVNHRIIYCDSSDGTNWSNFQMIIDKGSEGTYDTINVYYPCVVSVDSIYKMWYVGYSGSALRILRCEADDGEANEKKIALTINNGTTQCPVEIERWNWSEREANLWTKVSTVYSGIDINLYLYYDLTKSDNTMYVGDTGDTPAQNVWDSNFKAVWHMSQDPNGDAASVIKDSTSNTNHGTPAGTMLTEDLVDGKIGKAIDFDGTDDKINCGSDSSLDVSDYTLEAIFEGHTTSNYEKIVSRNDGGVHSGFYINIKSDNKVELVHWIDPGYNIIASAATYTSGYHHIVGTFKAGVGSELFVNSISEGTDNSETTAISSYTQDFVIAAQDYVASPQEFNGIIDEVRLSNIKRTDAWIKATYYSNWNDLITYGSEEFQPTHYYDGYITEEGSPVIREVRLYYRDTGQLMDETTSSGVGGYYYLTTTISGEHFIVVFDDDIGKSYNALILDKLLPRGIE